MALQKKIVGAKKIETEKYVEDGRILTRDKDKMSQEMGLGNIVDVQGYKPVVDLSENYRPNSLVHSINMREYFISDDYLY